VTLVVIVAAGGGGTGAAGVAPPGGAEVQRGESCPLSSAQQLNSIKTFVKMMPVFRHPRCINCHGAMPDPLNSPASARHAGVVEMDSTDNNRTCEECHMNDWGDAARAPDWTDKSDMDLCRGMHVVFEHDAPRFIDHMLRDGGNVAFIEAAFVGKRGLSEGGQTIYEGETGQPFSAAPPPGTHGRLVQQLGTGWRHRAGSSSETATAGAWR